jgi:hypothetical protein
MADNTDKLDSQVRNLQARGVSLPMSPARKKLEAGHLHKMGSMTTEERHKDILGSTSEHVKQLDGQNELMRAMGANRGLRKKASGSDVYAAVPRMYDPLEYFDLSGLPWNVADEGHRKKLHKWMRLYYATHYLVPILIDIFTRFPLVGMELKSPDPQLNRFYEDLFFDQLDYADFLVSMGREVWTVGEAFPFGSFNEDLGIWEREELLNPEDVTIDNYPLLGEKELRIVPPDYLKKLAMEKSPAKEYRMLELNFPEIIPYLRKDKKIPISGVLLKQVANKQTDWDDHGTPILLRGLKTLMHEERLMASQEGIAERLYSPLILAKLGIMDLGDNQGPWIPTPDELEAVRDDMDTALASDFRLLVHHFGLEIENVFGREQMPRLGDDFDRIERRLMQIFGVNPSLLSAGAGSQPYASSALQAEFLNQILRTFQGRLKKHFHDRAVVVAEAHGHYAYETRGDTRVPIMEEVLITDVETGEIRKETRNKLLVPTLEFSTFDLRDEATERQFLQQMRTMGVPIPDDKMMIGVTEDIGEMAEQFNDELVEKTVAQQKAKMKAYKSLQNQGLPVPPDLKAEVETVLGGGPVPGQEAPPGGGMGGPPPGGPPGGGGPKPGGGGGLMGGPPPGGPGGGGMGGPGLGPDGIQMPDPPGGIPGGPPARAPNDQGIGNGFAPPASFERRTHYVLKTAKDREDFAAIGEAAGVDWGEVDFDVEALAKGIEEEREHAEAVGGDEDTIVQIVIDHLTDQPDYYELLEQVHGEEEEGEFDTLPEADEEAEGEEEESEPDKVAAEVQLRQVDRTDKEQIVERIREPKHKRSYSFIEDPDLHPIEDEVDEQPESDQPSESSG